MSEYGYIRVSSKDQNENRQIDAMRQAGIADENMFIDKASGKDFEREQYIRMVQRLQPRDVVFVQSIDRLGRNYEAIIEEWNALTKKARVDIVILDMPLLDTRKGKNLTGTLISDIVLQLLSYVAQTERENIKKRQAEGIAAARARNVKFGRPPKDLPPNFAEIYVLWQSGEITGLAAADACGMAMSTFRYRAAVYASQKGKRVDS
ncbi:MAG: recombinase family protein [Oscillospiraceae bacterium]|nr:recombinase family protein [Oscillospiraceae bacterium]